MRLHGIFLGLLTLSKTTSTSKNDRKQRDEHRAGPDIFEARGEVTKLGPLIYIIKVQVYIIKKMFVNGSFY